MSDLPIKATFKSGAGYDAPWLTVDAADPNDLTFKLNALLGGDSLTKVIAVAEMFKAANTAGPLVAGTDPTPTQAGTQQPAQQPQWSQPQQQAPQQRQGGNHPSAQLHPEGKACEQCGTTLEHKKTQTGKAKWQCPQWRWQNGNPNGHSMEWVN